MFHNASKNPWLERKPVKPFSFGDGNKISTKKTAVMPSTWKRRRANGDLLALSESAKSAVPCAITGTPGMNFNVAGFGVSCV
jgi:hypothetical protein